MIAELAMTYYNQGTLLAGEGRITPAKDRLEKAVALDPKNWKAWNVLGLCQYQLGAFSKAKGAWQESLERYKEGNPALGYLKELESPEFIAWCQRYNQALELASKENYKGAIKVLGRVEDYKFTFIPVLNFTGLCLYGAGKPRKAIGAWKKALELDRDNPDAQNYIFESIESWSLGSTLVGLWKKITDIFSSRRGGNERP